MERRGAYRVLIRKPKEINCLKYLGVAAAEQSSYYYMCCCTHCLRDTLSESSYKQKKVEGNYIPPMPGLKRGEN